MAKFCEARRKPKVVPNVMSEFDMINPTTNATRTAMPMLFAAVAAPRINATWVGVSAPIPTQVALILGAATAAKSIGIAVLVAFVVGLIMSNSLITLGTTFGFLRASQNFAIYAT